MTATAQPAQDWRTLPAGPALDALVAHHVFGWLHQDSDVWLSPDGLSHFGVAPYSSSIAAAWTVRAEMQRRDWESEDRMTWIGWGEWDKHPFGYSIWFKRWERHPDGKLTGGESCHHAHTPDFNEAPLVVCRAALSAVETP